MGKKEIGKNGKGRMNRREFMKTSAAAVGAVMTAGVVAPKSLNALIAVPVASPTVPAGSPAEIFTSIPTLPGMSGSVPPESTSYHT